MTFPEGVRSISTPLTVPGCVLWLDASDIASITMDGSNKVSQWSDKSGNAKHAVQATGANQPTYNATAFGGKPALDWGTGSVAAMRLTTPNIGLGAYTFFAVVRGDANAQTVIFHGDIGNFGEIYCFHSGHYSIGANRANVFTGRLFTNWLRDGIRRVVVSTFNGTSQSHQARRNGALMETTSQTLAEPGTAVVTAPVYIGNADPTWYGPAPMAGLIAEIIVFDRCLSDGEIFLVEKYLANKWPTYAASRSIASPLEVPDCVLWLDAADSAITKDGSDNVSQWNDLSGNARHATNASGAATKPLYLASSISGRPALQFLQANDSFLDLPAGVAPSGDAAHTAFMVAKRISGAGTGARAWLRLATTTGVRTNSVIGANHSTGAAYFGTAGVATPLGDVLALDAPQILTKRYRASTQAPTNLEGWTGRTGRVTESSLMTLGNTAGWLGCSVATASADFAVSAAIVYDRALTDGERVQVERYLERKYGL